MVRGMREGSMMRMMLRLKSCRKRRLDHRTDGWTIEVGYSTC